MRAHTLRHFHALQVPTHDTRHSSIERAEAAPAPGKTGWFTPTEAVTANRLTRQCDQSSPSCLSKTPCHRIQRISRRTDDGRRWDRARSHSTPKPELTSKPAEIPTPPLIRQARQRNRISGQQVTHSFTTLKPSSTRGVRRNLFYRWWRL